MEPLEEEMILFQLFPERELLCALAQFFRPGRKGFHSIRGCGPEFRVSRRAASNFFAYHVFPSLLLNNL
jgi:hypothetical protein